MYEEIMNYLSGGFAGAKTAKCFAGRFNQTEAAAKKFLDSMVKSGLCIKHNAGRPGCPNFYHLTEAAKVMTGR